MVSLEGWGSAIELHPRGAGTSVAVGRGAPVYTRGRRRGVAQLGSALALGARGRGFESRHPDHPSTTAPVAGPHPQPPRRRALEEHRRDPEPDAGPARRRGALRRAQAKPRRGVQARSPSRSACPASGRARSRPRIIDQRVGRAAVLEEAVQDALPRAYSDAVRENELRAARPARDRADQARRRREPRVHRRGRRAARDDAAGATTASTVTVDDVGGHDDDVDEQVYAMRERFAVLKASSGRCRTATTSRSTSGPPSTARRCRAARPPACRTRSAPATMMDGLDEALVGAVRGGQPRPSRPRWSPATSPAGPPTSRSTVRSVKDKELPELDDEFAQTASEFDTLDELRADVRDRLQRVKVLEQGAQARDKVLEPRCSRPPTCRCRSRRCAARYDWRQHDIGHQLEQAGLDLDDLSLASESQDQGGLRRRGRGATPRRR